MDRVTHSSELRSGRGMDNRWTYGNIDRMSDGGIETDRRTEIQRRIDWKMITEMGEHIEGRTDRQTDGWMDERMNRYTHGLTDRQRNTWTNIQADE